MAIASQNALTYGQRVVQYRRLRREMKHLLHDLCDRNGVAVPAVHLTANDPPDPYMTPITGTLTLTAGQRAAVDAILRARTSLELGQALASIAPAVYSSGPVTEFHDLQDRLIAADHEREAAYGHYRQAIGDPHFPPTTIQAASSPPSQYNWGNVVPSALGGHVQGGTLRCGAPQTGHGVQGQPCDCPLGEDLLCYYHPDHQ